jgi:SAM-dependent methyltransferase
MAWNEGYVVEEAYTSGFFRKQSPVHLSVACAINGFEPIDTRKPFTYLELGSGQGFTANLLAASNPFAQFYAADFMPGHIVTARELAVAARLGNVTHLEKSFAELAAGHSDLPPLDFITLHGVYSWVNPENRRHIVDFIGRHLKPGGIVYVSYNAMPGWSAATPLQRLVLEHARAVPGRLEDQVNRAKSLIDGLIGAKAGYFTANENGVLRSRLDSWAKDKPVYLAHEYMNQSWQALYHADVVRDFASAKLDFAASAELCMNVDPLQLPAEQREIVQSIDDPVLRETVLDYLQNTAFRSDVFIRGARRMGAARRQQWWEQIGLALTVPRRFATLGQASDVASGSPVVGGSVLDLLEDGPKSVQELADRHGCAPDAIVNLMSLLVWHDQGAPFIVSAQAPSKEASLRLNAVVSNDAVLQDRYQALASPMLGSGINSSVLQRLIHHALRERAHPIDRHALTQWIWQVLTDQGPPIVLGHEPLPSKEIELIEIRRAVDDILLLRVPIWQQLHMI